MKLDIPQFGTQQEMFKWLTMNKSMMEAMKKSENKEADAIIMVPTIMQKVLAAKQDEPVTVQEGAKEIQALVVINTTNWMDSHDDVHIPGLWDKSLKEQKLIYHIQEHQMKFENVISDEVKAGTRQYSFKELGFDVPGTTEALVFDSLIKEERNPEMFKAYRKGWVKNHSVGMQYVKLYLCINSDEAYSAAEKDAWNKYYPMIANKEQADAKGYFWAVTEAKVIEGSAVVKGSNFVTPTVSVSDKAATGTLYDEPLQSTQQKTHSINWEKVIANL